MSSANNTNNTNNVNTDGNTETPVATPNAVPSTPSQGQEAPTGHAMLRHNIQMPAYAYYPPPGLPLPHYIGHGQSTVNGHGQPTNNGYGTGYGYASYGYAVPPYSMPPPGQNSPTSTLPMPPPNQNTPASSVHPRPCPCPCPRAHPCKRPEFNLPDDFGNLGHHEDNGYQAPASPPPLSPPPLLRELPGPNQIMQYAQQTEDKPTKKPKQPKSGAAKASVPVAKVSVPAVKKKDGNSKGKKREVSDGSEDSDHQKEPVKKKGRSEGATSYGTAECKRLVELIVNKGKTKPTGDAEHRQMYLDALEVDAAITKKSELGVMQDDVVPISSGEEEEVEPVVPEKKKKDKKDKGGTVLTKGWRTELPLSSTLPSCTSRKSQANTFLEKLLLSLDPETQRQRNEE
ncbi:hypothetical protein BDP27DRAFT_1428059 [Rhodocollybia butyracea]|uniref:Uncharacterized protein n=1 Tax=Rhodocollybia butyracea TaxID=206335 RepID=A0A9P5U0W6_9AGAR|nr:hypothetical protein BDP27DRAFT_1428059 [Rhodocollybia butyracea]